MAEELSLIADWRYDPRPITVYRNPGQRERLRLLNDNHKVVRFVLTGKGEIFAGRAYEFLHGDAHTYLRHIYGANFIHMGCIWVDALAAWRFSESEGRAIIPMNQDRSLTPLEESDSVLDSEGHSHDEVYGFLMASNAFRRFTLGMRMPEAETFGIPQDPNALVNPDRLPDGEWMLMLHDDGCTYAFPWVEGQHNLDYDPYVARGGFLGFGGKATVDGDKAELSIHWSGASHPEEIALDNRNMVKLVVKGLVITRAEKNFISSVPKKWEPRS
jgi:hypothetical protein